MFGQIERALDAAGIDPASAVSLAERVTRPQVRALAAIASGPVAEIGDDAVSRASTHRTARELERALGLPLLEAGPNGLATTEAGGELARRLTIALQEVDSGIGDIGAEEQRQGG
jgi:LysR family transcriptional regulator of gallate degradation